MQMNEFDILLKDALIIAAQEDYFYDMPANVELDEIVTPSKEFERRVTRMIKNPTSYARKQLRPIYKKALHIAAMIALSFAILLGAAMLLPEARAAIIRVVTSWLGDHTEYEFVDRSYNRWGSEIELGYVPEGFELVLEDVDEQGAFIVYQKGDSLFDVYISGVETVPHIDNEHSNFYHSKIRDLTADVYEGNSEKDPSTVVLYDEEARIFLICSGEIKIEEIIKILEGLVIT